MLNQFFAFLFILLNFCFYLPATSQDFAVLHKGRFQPAEAYARAWLYDFYHDVSIQPDDRLLFHTASPAPLDWLKNLHFQGYLSYQTAPLFWIQSPLIKKFLQIPSNQTHSSYQELFRAFYLDPLSSQQLAKRLITYHFLQAYTQSPSPFQSSFELPQLLPGLIISFKNQQLRIKKISSPHRSWHFLNEGLLIDTFDLSQRFAKLKQDKKFVQEVTDLLQAMERFESVKGSLTGIEQNYLDRFSQLQAQRLLPKEIAKQLEQEFSINQRLKTVSPLFLALPWEGHPGEWLSLQALLLSVYSPLLDQVVPIENFTSFPSTTFKNLQQLYKQWNANFDPIQSPLEAEQFFQELGQAYRALEGTIYQEAHQKQLRYPSRLQLQAEAVYTRTSWTFYLIGLYILSCLTLILAHFIPSSPRLTFLSHCIIGITFACHTLLLLIRCFILKRPPVSNMAETVIYVPWVTMLFVLSIPLFRRQFTALLAACCAALVLLSILEWTQLNQQFDQLQAVLDSQFWLMTHVLLVVGSYGLFIFGAVLGHFYLGLWLFKSSNETFKRALPSLILQTLYTGTILLIVGTVLGGIWAAESWGRFWDWDPKESWAFISSCLYLIWIHAYRFHKIASFGLAIGAVSGFLAISFTWYGVNYILGTGLHSYGFGSGGEKFYYAYFIGELLFILSTLFIYNYRNKLQINH
jgi:ABC-type transport system involved in cytochrome c biogenesis permease subunit